MRALSPSELDYCFCPRPKPKTQSVVASVDAGEELESVASSYGIDLEITDATRKEFATKVGHSIAHVPVCSAR